MISLYRYKKLRRSSEYFRTMLYIVKNILVNIYNSYSIKYLLIYIHEGFTKYTFKMYFKYIL